MSLPQAGDQALTALYEQVLNQVSLRAGNVQRSPAMTLNHLIPGRPVVLPPQVQQLPWPMLQFGPQGPPLYPPVSMAYTPRPAWVGPVAHPQPMMEQGGLLYGNPMAPFLSSAQGLLSACLMEGPDAVNLIKTLTGVLQAAAYTPAHQGAHMGGTAFADVRGSIPYGVLAALAQATCGRNPLGGVPPSHGVLNPALQLPHCVLSGPSPSAFVPATPSLQRPAAASYRASELEAAPKATPRLTLVGSAEVPAPSRSKADGQPVGGGGSMLMRQPSSSSKTEGQLVGAGGSMLARLPSTSSHVTPQPIRPRVLTASGILPRCGDGEGGGVEEGKGAGVGRGEGKPSRPSCSLASASQQKSWPAALGQLLLPLMVARLEVRTCGGRQASQDVVQGRMVMSMLMARQEDLHCFLESMARAGTHGTAPKLPIARAQGQIRQVLSQRRRPFLLTKRAQSLALRSQPPPAEADSTDRSTSFAAGVPQVKEEPLDKPSGDVVGSIIYDITILPCGLIALPAPIALRSGRRDPRKHSRGKLSSAHPALAARGGAASTGHKGNGGLEPLDHVGRAGDVPSNYRKAFAGLSHDGIKERRILSQWSLPPVNVTAVPDDVTPRSSSLDATTAGVIQPGFVEWRNGQSHTPPSKKQRLGDSSSSSADCGGRPSPLPADVGTSYPMYGRLVAPRLIVNATPTSGILKPVASRKYLKEPNSAKATPSSPQSSGVSQEGCIPQVYSSTLRAPGPEKAFSRIKKSFGKAAAHRPHLKPCKSQNIVLLATAAGMLEKGQDIKTRVASPDVGEGSPLSTSTSPSAMHGTAGLGTERRKYLGVGYKPKTRRWYAQLRNGKEYYWLGCNFTNPEDAARAYDRVARALRGPSTQPINFPLDQSDAIADMQLHVSETDPIRGSMGEHGKQKPRAMLQFYMASGEQGELKQLLTGKAKPLGAYEQPHQDLQADHGVLGHDGQEQFHSFATGQQRRGTSRYRGVCRFNAKTGVSRWKAQIVNAGQVKHLGYFATEEDAARAFDRSAIVLRGPRADINFPREA